jgi:Spy/CpxP family protein refolding chaperone
MKLRQLQALVVVAVLAVVGTAFAQGGPGPGAGAGPGGDYGMRGPRPHGRDARGEMRNFRDGKWWKNSELVKKLGLTDAQVQQIDKAFMDHRAQLIDLRAALDKEELKLQPLMEADSPNEGQVTAQIEKIAQSRANLEKSNALMLLGIRRVLSVEQWKQLQAEKATLRPRARRPGPPPAPPVPPVQ